MVRGSVWSCHSGSVEHQGDGGFVKSNIHDQLVKRAVSEGRIDGNDRMQPSESHAGCAGHSMLLGNSNVKDSVRILLCHPVKTNRNQHRTGKTNHLLIRVCDFDDLIGKHRGPRGLRAHVERFASRRVDLTNRVKLVFIIHHRRVVALALLRDRVHNHRVSILFSLSQGCFHSLQVVTVHRADVLDI